MLGCRVTGKDNILLSRIIINDQKDNLLFLPVGSISYIPCLAVALAEVP